jgi:hypothetical protein
VRDTTFWGSKKERNYTYFRFWRFPVSARSSFW